MKAINLHGNHTGNVERQECKFGPLDIVKLAHSLKVRVPKAAQTNQVVSREGFFAGIFEYQPSSSGD
jgi:hypothetical protein